MLTGITNVLQKYKIYFLALMSGYGILALHDSILYPHLGFFGILQLAGLRLLLLFIPIASTWGLMSKRKTVTWISAGLWILFIPYTLYSLLEVRHVSEICRITEGYFTQSCANITWQVIPSFLYGLMGLGVFVFSLNKLTKHLSAQVAVLCIGATTLYIAATSVYGIFTRINTWELFVSPITTLSTLSLINDPIFVINVIMIWVLFFMVSISAIFWIQNRDLTLRIK